MDLKQVQSEVDAMNKGLGVSQSRDDTTEPPKTETPKTEVPTTEPPTEAPKTEDPKTAAPKTEVPTTDAPIDPKDKEIAELRAKLIEKETGPKPTKAPTTEAPIEVQEQDFVGEIDPSELTKEELNKLLNKVFTQGVTLSVKTTRTIIPGTVSSEIENATKLKEINDNFYAANKDLKAFPKVVATIFGELAAADPKKTMTDVLKDTAPEVRKRLGLPEPKPGKSQQPKPNNQQDKDRGKPPKLPGKKGKSGGHADNKPSTGIAAEIDAMNEIIGR